MPHKVGTFTVLPEGGTLQMTKTKAKRLTPEKAYALIMECHQSGLSNKQWLVDNGICQSTFYKWVKKLRESACYNFPPDNRELGISAVPVKQEVVRINVVPDDISSADNTGRIISASADREMMPPMHSAQDISSPVIIQLAGANILINDCTNPEMLTSIIRSLREALC
jgi:transposase-like protein